MECYRMGSRVVNAYLYRAACGWVLVDTGYAGGFARLQRQLRRRGIRPREISLVFLTHAHDDHAGFLAELMRAVPEVRVVLHPAAVERLRRGQNVWEGGCTSRLALGFCHLMAAFGKGEHRFPPCDRGQQDRLIPVTDENRAELEQLLEGRIYETPGHTADSISLLHREGQLFCGDAAMNGFPSLHHITIWVEDPAAFASSWELILRMKPERILPGHGSPFRWRELERQLPFARQIRLLPLPRK